MNETETRGGTVDPEMCAAFERYWRRWRDQPELDQGMRANLRLLAWDFWQQAVAWAREERG